MQNDYVEMILINNNQNSNNVNSFPKYRITSDEPGKRTSPINNRNNILSQNKVNTKRSTPFSISFGQNHIPAGNINYNINNQN